MLLHDGVCRDKGVAALSPEAAVLFFLLLSRVNLWGKMEGDVYTIKGLCCRYIDYITIDNLPGLLQEISRHTSVKWWEDSDGHRWVHALRYGDYNKNLRKDRRGKDKLPSYKNAFTPGVLQSEVEVEVEVEVEGEVEKTPPISPPEGGGKVPARRFVAPTYDEVRAECQAHGYPIDAEEWVDYWTSCAWKMGARKPMKDWRAALRNRARHLGWTKLPKPAPPAQGTFIPFGG